MYAREALLRLLGGQSDGWVAVKSWWAGWSNSPPTQEDKRQSVRRCSGCWLLPTARLGGPRAAGGLQLDQRGGQAPARDALECWPTRPNGGWPYRVGGRWSSSPRRRRIRPWPARRRSGRWSTRPNAGWPEKLVGGIIQLAPTAEDKGQAQAGAARVLVSETDGRVAERLLSGMIQLDPESAISVPSRLGGPANRRIARYGALELVTVALAAPLPSLASLSG